MAMVKGMVVTRRGVRELWAGRALTTLGCAKDGFLSEDEELLEWKRIMNDCMVCGKDKPMRVG